MPIRSWILTGLTVAALGVSLSLAPVPQSADAQNPQRGLARKGAKEKSRPNQPVEPPMELTPAREAQALKFAEIHHDELKKLLVGMKGRNRYAYDRAMRQLYRDSERLARMAERQPGERYDFALKTWKLDSRIRLLAARVYARPKPDKKQQAELDALLDERVELQVRQMESERRRLADRLQKLDESIEGLRNNREGARKQQLARFKRSLGIKTPPRRKPLAKAKGKKSDKKSAIVKERPSGEP